jgi:hypothetical protein
MSSTLTDAFKAAAGMVSPIDKRMVVAMRVGADNSAASQTVTSCPRQRERPWQPEYLPDPYAPWAASRESKRVPSMDRHGSQAWESPTSLA